MMTDKHAATALELYIDNDGSLYRSQTLPILKSLTTKKARGTYKHALAVKLFGYLVEAGAKKYAKELGTPNQPWNKMFDVQTRKTVAEALTNSFETEHSLGNYDQLLPKKYQKPKRVPALATPEWETSESRHAANKRGHSPKLPTQLDREIAEVVPSWRGGR
jgi:hypothetical protein